MKKSILMLAVLFPLFCLAQNEKGGFFIETGIPLFGGVASPFLVGSSGISYSQDRHFVEKDGKVKSFPFYKSNVTYFSFAPRMGYFLSNKTSVGIDIRNYNQYSSYHYHEDYWNVLSGVFLRYYILNNKTSPYIEAAAGTGLSKEVTRSTSSSTEAINEKIKFFNLPYISGSAGFSFRLGSRFKLGIAATIQNTFQKPNKMSNFSIDPERVSILETGLIATISYNFKINKKKKE